jgi:hypothetical protein
MKELECDNIFCLHYEPIKKNLAKWNRTNCFFYEIDPYCRRNKKGFRVKDCKALKKYKKYGW